MSEDRRLSELIGLERRPAITEAIWPTNVALGCLGGAILWIAFRFLKWDDPRPIFNPWLYTIVTPLVLVCLSLLLRRVVSRVVERSAQVAFLLSVMVHLVLLVYALDVVIYTRMWPAFFEALAVEKEKLIHQERSAIQYFSATLSTNSSNTKRPEYLRYVPTKHHASDTRLSDESRLELARNEKAAVVSPEPKSPTQAQPFLIERQQPSPSMSVSMEAPASLSRAEVAMPAPTRSNAEPMEAMRVHSTAPSLAAADTSSRRSRAGDATLPPAAHALLESAAIGASAPPLGIPQVVAPGTAQPDLAAASVQLRDTNDIGGRRDGPRTRSTPVPLPDSTRERSSAATGLGPALGRRERSADGAASQLSTPSLIDAVGGATNAGLGNLARSALATQSGSIGGMPGGAGIDRGSFSLPRGDLGASSGPPATGRIDVPESATNGQGVTGNTGLGIGPSSQTANRRARDDEGVGQLRIDMAAQPGVGGISLSPGAGPLIARNVPSAPALELPSLDIGRFSRDEIGGPLAGGVAGAVPAPAFQQRIDRLKDDEGGDAGPSGPQTEQAIERGLEFLAKHQRPEGRWRLQDLDKDVLIHSDTAATGLCLLAFQGAGYTHKQYKYSETNGNALKYLIEHQRSNGDLYIPQDPASDQNAWLYSHGIATLALCEAYGMTQDPELRAPAQLAVKFMVDSQEPQRGGWRYRPNVGADTSVTGWFMMALKSAQLAGLEVPRSTFDRMSKFVEASRASAAQPHLFRYNPFAPDTVEQRHGLKPTHVMTSVGLLMRLYLGWQRDLPEMQAGTDYLLSFPPELGTADATKRDTYYWYYATQVLFHMGGERWKKWNDKLRPLLLDAQILEGDMAGSWDPYLPSADLWARYGGRLYVTTLNLLSLEVHYRHLPLYDATAK